MKEIFSNFWNGSGASVSGAITAGLTYVLAADIQVSDGLLIFLGALASMLGFMAGPQKAKK